MARVRSPNYPSFSLPEAINRVKVIHAAEQHLAAPRDVIARHLGYNGLNGASLSAISALNKYGLLEDANGDKVKVSSAALAILYPSKPEEKAIAIKSAALRPALFAEIAEEWGGERPSDENLRSFLIRKNFASDAVDRVIRSYRETMDLVAESLGAYDSGSSTPQEEPKLMNPQAATVMPTATRGGMSVSFDGNTLAISAALGDAASVDKLIRVLEANKALLPEKKDEAAN